MRRLPSLLLLAPSIALLAIVVIVIAAVAAGTQGPFMAAMLQGEAQKQQKAAGPILHDGDLRLELVAQGLEFPTSMAFVAGDTLLVLQKNDGRVMMMLDSDDDGSDGTDSRFKEILRLDVANGAEQGLLGIASIDDEVFLYLTEEEGKEPLRNRVYKYDWNGSALANPEMILDLPAEPGPYHNGGKMAIGPASDGRRLYAVIGDTGAGGGVLDNQKEGGSSRPPDDKSVVFRVDRETGEAPHGDGGPFPDFPRYFAYGIRNSFGMDFDPVTGTLWMTENGPDRYDEINVVRSGFNSGWHLVSGPIARSNATAADLVMLGPAAYYGDPVFSWERPVGVTDIEFFSSGKLGPKYENNVFVGDINNGNLYFFTVNATRTGLALEEKGGLADGVADADDGNGGTEDLSYVLAGAGFGRITDIETGPADGYLYILTYEDGKVYRVRR